MIKKLSTQKKYELNGIYLIDNNMKIYKLQSTS